MSHWFPLFSKLATNVGERFDYALGVGPAWLMQSLFGDTVAGMQNSLLHVLAVANREHLEIVPLLRCLAAEHRGRFRSQLLRLARRMESGMSLCAALEQTPDILSPEDVLAIRFATQSGTLPGVFEKLLSDHQEDELFRQANFNYSSRYWLLLTIIIALSLLMMVNLVAPMFTRLGGELDVPVPGTLQVLLATFGSPTSVAWILVGFLIVGWWLTQFRLPRRIMAQRIAPRLLRPVAERRLVSLYRMLASVLEAGRPLPGAISTLARYHFDSRLRNKLLVVRNEIEQGEDAWKSLAETGVITPGQCQALQGSARSDLRAWIFKRLASQKLSSICARTAAMTALVEPLLVLFFASIVLWICYSFFAYLAGFIQWLA